MANTGDIAAFKILSESGVASGVRRIEALTGQSVLLWYQRLEESAVEASKLLKITPEQLPERILALQNELKKVKSENEKLKSAKAKESIAEIVDEMKTPVDEISGIKLVVHEVDHVDANGLRELGDALKGQIGEGVIVLASSVEGKVSLVVMATEGAVHKGIHAGNLIRGISGKVSGGGGGRPAMAQAGGKNPEGIPDALDEAKKLFRLMLG